MNRRKEMYVIPGLTKEAAEAITKQRRKVEQVAQTTNDAQKVTLKKKSKGKAPQKEGDISFNSVKGIFFRFINNLGFLLFRKQEPKSTTG